MNKTQKLIFHVSELTNLIGESIYSVTDDLVAWNTSDEMGESVQITLVIHKKGFALLIPESLPRHVYYTLYGYANRQGIEESPETRDLATVGDVVNFYNSDLH